MSGDWKPRGLLSHFRSVLARTDQIRPLKGDMVFREARIKLYQHEKGSLYRSLVDDDADRMNVNRSSTDINRSRHPTRLS